MRNLLFAFFGIILLIGCQSTVEKTPELSQDDQIFYSGYVQSYTSGIKSKTTSVEVELAKEIEDIDLSQAPSVDMLKITP